jgi:hypothetical protein
MESEIIFPNWFLETNVDKIFEDNLKDYAGKRLDFLQIGAFTGDASLWLLENILTHQDSTLTDVDPWAGDPGLKGFDWWDAGVEYEKKLSSYFGKVIPKKMTSDEFFKKNELMYDIIYIDGDHCADSVLRDAVHAFDSLKDNGLLIFDDYEFGYHQDAARFCPKTAIDAFMTIHWFDFEKVHESRQMWLKKTNRIYTNKIYNWQHPRKED